MRAPQGDDDSILTIYQQDSPVKLSQKVMSKIKENEITQCINSLMGEVLTIIEAIVPATKEDTISYVNGQMYSSTTGGIGNFPQRENTQREAVKQLVKAAFNRTHKDLVK